MKAQKIIFALVALITLTGCGKVPSSSSSDSGSSSSNSEERREVRFAADHLTFTPTPLVVVDDEWVTIPNMEDSKTYWSSVNWNLRGEALLDALKAKMRTTFKQVTYRGALDAVREMDRDPANSRRVLSLYDLKSQHEDDDYVRNWNREHAFPQSKLYDGIGWTSNNNVRADNDLANIASDVANLFVADAALNTGRSNYAYGGNWNYEENPDLYYRRLQENIWGELTDNILYYGLYSPTPMVRGEVARSQLYMLVNWKGAVVNNANFAIEDMIQWSLDFPRLNERDGQRQRGILKYQGIRNPFIDNRKVACYIWSEVNSRTKKACANII